MSNSQDITTNLRAVLSFYKKLGDKTPYYNPIYYNGDEIDIRKKLTLALNSIGAFVDIMAMFDAQPDKMAINDPEKIIEGYSEFDAVDKVIQRK